jgi:cell division protein FtsB
MAILVGMATTTLGDQPFSRIVETRKTTSWSVAVPIALFVVIAIGLIAYFAAKNTQAREQLAQVEQSAQQNQQALSQLQQKVAATDADISKLRDAGRTTVILQSATAGKRGKAVSGAWGAATWGEQTDGKSWLRLNAYGLAPAPSGKTYDLWFVSATGDSILVGKLDPNTDGSAYVEGRDLPAVDQGKSVLVSLDDENAKSPAQPLFQAALPKLKPSQHAAPSSSKEQAQEQSGTQSDTAQGRRAAPQKR